MMGQTKWSRWWVVGMVAWMGLGCNGDEEEEPAEAPGTLLVGEAEPETDPQVSEEDFDAFSEDNRSFSFDLFEVLRAEEEGNIFVSPHSISTALAMTYGGADGGTADEMAQALRFEVGDEVLHPAFNRLSRALAERDEVELQVVNQTWGQADYPFVEDYLDLLVRHYDAGMYAVDYGDDPDGIRQGINDWVLDQTAGHIEDLLPPGSIDALTRLVLVNAIYFKADWERPFSADHTADGNFERVDGTEVEVELMRHEDPVTASYVDDGQSRGISMAYEGEELSMVAIKPVEADGFGDWEQDLDREYFDALLGEMDEGVGNIQFPKFKDEGEYDLVPVMEALGMEEAFDEMRADFGKMIDLDATAENPFITGIFHQTFVEVDEKGTEAAAATGVVVGTESEPMMDFEMRFDRPFYYAIYDHGTESILFMGRMMDPS